MGAGAGCALRWGSPGRLWGLGASEGPPALPRCCLAACPVGHSTVAEWLLWLDGDVWLELPGGVVGPVTDREETGACVRQAASRQPKGCARKPLDPERGRPGAGSGWGPGAGPCQGPVGAAQEAGGLERQRRPLQGPSSAPGRVQGPPSPLVTAQPRRSALSSAWPRLQGRGLVVGWAVRSLGRCSGAGLRPLPRPAEEEVGAAWGWLSPSFPGALGSASWVGGNAGWG